MTVSEPITHRWEIRLRDPDAPGAIYCYPYYLRSAVSAWDEFFAMLEPQQIDRFVGVAESATPDHLTKAFSERLTVLAPCTMVSIPATATKTLPTVERLGKSVLAAGITRSSVTVAFGGRRAGKMASLLSAMYLQGLPLVQVPTTLAAQLDSCLSLTQEAPGDDGQHHCDLFSVPQLVWSHLALLEMLPARAIQSALCELIKYALAVKPEMVDEVLAFLRPDARYSQIRLARAIELCIDAKTTIMANEAMEKHEAMVLEYGHTVGHAIEVLARGQISHGEAMGIGMLVEADIAHHLGMLSTADVRMHYALLHANGTSTAILKEMNVERLLEIIRRDNKRGSHPAQPGMYNLVLLEGLGQPHRTGETVLTQVPEQDVRAALNRCRIA